ncbi:MAG TPA: hypothetical protein VMV69_28275, partial [Pirellulales bacterium]|nr:hypothetical protein [Pirellulales bacterium]
MGLLGCRSRQELAWQGDLFACLGPRVHAAQGLVNSAVCATCECRDEPADDEYPAANTERLAATNDRAHAAGNHCACPETVSGAHGARRVTAWAVGVTTAPRARSTLDQSLASLADAGWRRPRLFAEPGTVLPECGRDLPVSRRDGKLGAFPNWYLGLSELFLREP